VVVTLTQATQIIDEALTYARNEGLAPMTVAVLGVGQLTNPLVAGWSEGQDR
jgi:uncharacterized protein GlcG (DUF336 family)